MTEHIKRNPWSSKNWVRGFTLIEVLVVVAIVGILASISIPSYTFYRYKSMTTEARTMLGAIRTNQEAFYAESDNYANISLVTPATLPTAVKEPWTIVDCPPTCSKDTTDFCSTFECIGFRSEYTYFRYGSVRLLSTISLAGEVASGAESDLDSDGNPGSFAVRSANRGGLVGYLGDPVSSCPPDIVAGEIVACTPVTF